MVKTNVMRLLDQAKLSYTTKEYVVDEQDLSGEHVAKQVGMATEQVFKTLVARGDKNKIYVFCIPANAELNLKKAASLVFEKKIEMVHVKELLSLTGYIRGGCSPVGMKKKYPTYLDETAQLFDTIAVSAGVRGCQIVINPDDLKTYIEAVYSDLTV
ncbi:MAG: ybaK [Anaerocolumna sp.]|jgi:Cys-tRNA(Pro)/Cys-tRNA(Cys) deacylase|nr:ybaK [Anaerocolumna sp.]